MKVRVTQIDIARVAGVHNTTVSLSLRNSRLIPDATRKRIQAIAGEMGYSPDPALRALAAYRNSRRPMPHANTIAYITDWETKWGWRDQPWHEKYFLGAQRKAAEIGYPIEHFWLGEAGMSQKRLSCMLLHRGITGVVLATHRMCGGLSDIDWSRLSAVKIGCFPQVPALNQVAVDHGSVVNLSMQRVLSAGCKRVGLVMSRCWDDLFNQAWSKAFFAEQYVIPARDRLPILPLGSSRDDLPSNNANQGRADDTRAFARWYRDYRPDAIVGLAPQVLAHVERLGLVVPRDVAYADLFLDHPGDELAGVCQNCERVGELAVELLAGQLQQNVFGVPAVATTTSVAGAWSDGASLPATGLPMAGEVVLATAAIVKADLVA